MKNHKEGMSVSLRCKTMATVHTQKGFSRTVVKSFEETSMYLIRGNIVPMPIDKRPKKRKKVGVKHCVTLGTTQQHSTQIEKPEPVFRYLLNVLNLNGACLKRSVVEVDPSQPKM